MQADSKIDQATLEAIEKGRCSIFLGAGASLAAGGPSTAELVAMLTPGNVDGQLDLNRAAELFVEARLAPDFFRRLLRRLRALSPSAEHVALPLYEWRAIVTTNYDSLVEAAYRGERLAFQTPTPIISEGDLIGLDDDDPLALPLVKLHGCITRPESIVMSWRDIYDAKRSRRLLFNYVESLHILGPVIYIGYSMSDTHILEMLYDLNKSLGKLRQRVYFVTRESDILETNARLWFSGRLRGEYLNYGFDGFIGDLMAHARPASGPSNIVRALAPCTARAFGGAATWDVVIQEEGGEWFCAITYTIGDVEGYAGVIFEINGDPVDLGGYTSVTFELWVEKIADRQKPFVDALKLETSNETYPYHYDISQMREREWSECRIPMGEYREQLDLTRIERIVFADNGHRVRLGETYTMKLRRVAFS